MIPTDLVTRLLTKMGWESGKGLGAKEDGATSHVKSAKRRDNLGLGADKSNEDNWLSHQLAFDDLLSHLNNHSENGGEGEKPKKKERSMKWRRQHGSPERECFTTASFRAKILSSKSAEDMACIFGQRSKSAPGTPQEQSEGEESDESTASCPPPSLHGVQTINTGQSVQEYFEMKMKEMKAARESRELGGEKKVEIAADKGGENGPKNSDLADEELKSKKKKKEKGRKRKSATEEASESKSDENGSLFVEDECSVKKRRKMRRGKMRNLAN
ncbi:PIN2/TERF1-interacting telomerase inhibitor 1 [Desmophyllum pertusum]|uniref:PIN2/TERF1-interacting telomerase inhibitor 1 n=1 Tax=Desmophyllum pertusum TaxID=174260 RepID=A0A9X0CZ17_9CNID|nr:PIN2/TERF1-interacting telomerase inhibitor 1 [Desmophyllum pertusum]